MALYALDPNLTKMKHLWNVSNIIMSANDIGP